MVANVGRTRSHASSTILCKAGASATVCVRVVHTTRVGNCVWGRNYMATKHLLLKKNVASISTFLAVSITKSWFFNIIEETVLHIIYYSRSTRFSHFTMKYYFTGLSNILPIPHLSSRQQLNPNQNQKVVYIKVSLS